MSPVVITHLRLGDLAQSFSETGDFVTGVSLHICSGYLPCWRLHFWPFQTIIRARAARSLLFFVTNDHIFHCLNIPQNSPNLEYRSHLPKKFIIYCHYEFSPLGGAHSKTLYLRVPWIVLSLVIHFRLPFCFTNSQNVANSSLAILPIYTKHCGTVRN